MVQIKIHCSSNPTSLAVMIRRNAQLGLFHQPNRRIQLIHHHFHQLHFRGVGELRIQQQLVEFVFSRHCVGFALSGLCAEHVEKSGVIPEMIDISMNSTSKKLSTYQFTMSLYLRCLPCNQRSMVYPLLLRTKIIGFNPCSIIVDNSCTVSCLVTKV